MSHSSGHWSKHTMTSSLIPDVDPTRTPWCLLTLRLSDEPETPRTAPKIVGWELGDGNPSNLVNTVSYPDEEETNHTALNTLGEQLTERQHEGTLLITASQDTIQYLRTNLAYAHLESESVSRRSIDSPVPRPSLHGFRHLPLKDVLENYFSDSHCLLRQARIDDSVDLSGEHETPIHPQIMWRLTRTILGLIPIETAQGKYI